MLQQQRQFTTPTYLVAISFVLIPLTDAIMQVLPLRIQDPKWRWGTFGLISNAFMLPLLGLLIAVTAATLYDHRRVQRVLGIVSVVVAVLLVGLFVGFTLDALQLHNDVKPQAQTAFQVGSATAAAKALLSVVTLGAFGMAAIRVSKAPRRTAPLGTPVIVTTSRPSAAVPARSSSSSGEESVSAPLE